MQKFYEQKFQSKSSKLDMLSLNFDNSETLLHSKIRKSESMEDEDYVRLMSDLRKNNKETFTQRLKQIENSQEGTMPLSLAQIQYFHSVKSDFLKEIKQNRGSISPGRKRDFLIEKEPLELTKKINPVNMSSKLILRSQKRYDPPKDISIVAK